MQLNFKTEERLCNMNFYPTGALTRPFVIETKKVESATDVITKILRSNGLDLSDECATDLSDDLNLKLSEFDDSNDDLFLAVWISK